MHKSFKQQLRLIHSILDWLADHLILTFRISSVLIADFACRLIFAVRVILVSFSEGLHQWFIQAWKISDVVDDSNRVLNISTTRSLLFLISRTNSPIYSIFSTFFTFSLHDWNAFIWCHWFGSFRGLPIIWLIPMNSSTLWLCSSFSCRLILLRSFYYAWLWLPSLRGGEMFQFYTIV